MKWLRKLFRLPFPSLSRAELAATLTESMALNWAFEQDLKRACLHGYWRLDHPLSKVCPPMLKSRHPRMTMEQIEQQYNLIMGNTRKLLVAQIEGSVVTYHHEIDNQ